MLVFYRMLLASIVLLFIYFFTQQKRTYNFATKFKLIGIGAIIALHWVCFYGSIKLANVSIALVCFSSTSMFTSLIEPLAKKIKIKWPNDIYIQDKKCGGILTEAREDFVIVGIGLNVMSAPPSGNARIEAIAVADVVQCPVSREMVLAALLTGIMAEIDACAGHFEVQLERLRKSCYLTGKSIKFSAHEKEFSGLVRGVGPDGALQVEVDGEVMSFSQASEINVL